MSATATLPARVCEPPEVRDYLSFSAVRLYQSCALKYMFRYVLGLPEETVPASLVFGGAIHRSLERHHRELLAGNAPPALDALMAEYQAGWQDRSTDDVRFGKDESSESCTRLAERMLSAFQASDAAKPRGRILAVEEELRGRVISGCPDLLARVDLIVEAGDALVVADWKTSRSRYSAEQLEDASEQLLLYSELAKDFAPGKPLRIEFVVLTKTKEVAVERHTLPVLPSTVSRTKRMVEAVWRAIDAGHFYPAPSPMSCPSCPYRRQCRQWCG